MKHIKCKDQWMGLPRCLRLLLKIQNWKQQILTSPQSTRMASRFLITECRWQQFLTLFQPYTMRPETQQDGGRNHRSRVISFMENICHFICSLPLPSLAVCMHTHTNTYAHMWEGTAAPSSQPWDPPPMLRSAPRSRSWGPGDWWALSCRSTKTRWCLEGMLCKVFPERSRSWSFN